MKQLVIVALAGSALALPNAASAAHIGVTFDSRGECESFLAEARNNARKMAMEGGQNSGEFNRDYPAFCRDNGDGTFTTDLEEEEDL
jgi:hypothetical protein